MPTVNAGETDKVSGAFLFKQAPLILREATDNDISEKEILFKMILSQLLNNVLKSLVILG